MGKITDAIGFGIGAVITTAAAGHVIKQIHKFPRPYTTKRKKKRR